MKQKLTPMKAKTFEQICGLKRDFAEIGDWYLGLDSKTVYLTEQALQGSATQRIKLPRNVFDKFVRWYVTGSKCGRVA